MNNPFEESTEKQIELVEQTSSLVKIDEFEEKIKLIDKLTKEYNKLKSEIKGQMIEAGKKINVEQVKWTTPKGIKITCSIGKPAEFEEVVEKQFNLEILMREYQEIYEKCCVEHTTNKCIKNASNDRLVITLPKED